MAKDIDPGPGKCALSTTEASLVFDALYAIASQGGVVMAGLTAAVTIVIWDTG